MYIIYEKPTACTLYGYVFYSTRIEIFLNQLHGSEVALGYHVLQKSRYVFLHCVLRISSLRGYSTRLVAQMHVGQHIRIKIPFFHIPPEGLFESPCMVLGRI
jgi:hypothetical protein